MDVNLPLARFPGTAGIHGHYDTLAAKFIGPLSNQLRIFDRGCIYRNLIGTSLKHSSHIFNTIDAAPYGKGNKDLFSSSANHVNHRSPAIGGGSYIQKN